MSFQNDWLKELQKSTLYKDLTKTVTEFDGLLKKGIEDVGTKTIETKFGKNKAFKTTIAIKDADVTNEFPAEPPNEDDIYWTRHNVVNKVLEARTKIILKSIEVAGTTVKGVINPISVSPIDIATLLGKAVKD